MVSAQLLQQAVIGKQTLQPAAPQWAFVQPTYSSLNMDKEEGTLAATDNVDIEIPEPDYDDSADDDDDDDVNNDDDAVDDVITTPVATTDDVTVTTTTDSQLQSQQPRVPDDDDDDAAAAADNVLPFNKARAKLEAFSASDKRGLTASISPDENVDIPEPDYSDSDEEQQPGNEAVDEGTKKDRPIPFAIPKEQQVVMRELLRNQKLGVNVLSQKSELDKEMEKRKKRQQQRNEEDNQRQKRSSFELRLEEQAQKLVLAEQQQQQAAVSSNSSDTQPEFIKVHSKINKVKSAS